MLLKKWSLIALGVVTIAPVIYVLAFTWFEGRQARQLQEKGRYAPAVGVGKRSAIVIYFSRSGNTALAARHIAHRLNAPIVSLEAPDYKLGPSGLIHAIRDARGNESVITPKTVDLTPYDTVYLASPVWLYSPAPPIWAFAKNNRFDGKHVVLFNTYNSHFAPEFIEAFRAQVLQNGARTFEHRYVLRGRWTRQLTPEQMTKAIDTVLFPE